MGNFTLCGDGVAEQTRCALANVQSVLTASSKAAGSVRDMTMADLVDCTIFLATMEYYAELNVVWAQAFKGISPPARAAFGAGPVTPPPPAYTSCFVNSRTLQNDGAPQPLSPTPSVSSFTLC